MGPPQKPPNKKKIIKIGESVQKLCVYEYTVGQLEREKKKTNISTHKVVLRLMYLTTTPY